MDDVGSGAGSDGGVDRLPQLVRAEDLAHDFDIGVLLVEPGVDRVDGFAFHRIRELVPDPQFDGVLGDGGLEPTPTHHEREAKQRERLEKLGATTQRFIDNGEAGQHYTMRDIEGNEFCLVPGPGSEAAGT